MKEKLIIENFGPIERVELELGRFNILIGESGSGKSTIVKLLSVCRYFSYLVDFEIFEDNFEKGLLAWGLNGYYNKNSYIYYSCFHYSFEAKYTSQNVSVYNGFLNEEHLETVTKFSTLLTPNKNSPLFEELLLTYKRLKTKAKEQNFISMVGGWQAPSIFYTNDVNQVLDNPCFKHAERSLESYFKLSKDSIANVSNALDNQFRDAYEISKHFTDDTFIDPLDLLYKFDGSQGLIKKKNEETFISLSNAASGYKSIIPIVLAIKYYTRIRKKKKKFIIEEPELNIYPKNQYEIIKFFAESLNFHKEITISTHSPYVLASLNNLMYAYKIGQNHKEEVNKITEQKYWVNPKDVSAYKLVNGGTAINILDNEEGMIESDKIDDVSKVLNEEFDKLMDLEFVKQ